MTMFQSRKSAEQEKLQSRESKGLSGSGDDESHTSRIELRVSDLRKTFTSPGGDRIEVLRGIDFSSVAGETVAITGASGSGKSTLLHLLGGLEKPDHGLIALNQFAINSAPDSAQARLRQQKIGFLFQFHHLLPDLTAAENVALPLMISRLPVRLAMARATRTLENLGIGARTEHSVGQLSGGEQQRVALARAFITRPIFLLADEPTGNLDSAAGEDIGNLLVRYSQEADAIVILATHNESLARLCDRVLTIESGRLYEA